MGADGHIRIIDRAKVKELFGVDLEGGYKYTILGREVNVTYFDYNYHMEDCVICGEWEYCAVHEELREKIEKSEANLSKNGESTDWEVWT